MQLYGNCDPKSKLRESIAYLVVTQLNPTTSRLLRIGCGFTYDRKCDKYAFSETKILGMPKSMPLRIFPLPKRAKITMPQTCTVCRHKNLSEINLALVSGEPLRSIAGRTGLAKSSLQRHKRDCIPRDVIQARQFGKIADADMLLGQVCSLQQRSEQILANAEQSKDYKIALAAVRELKGLLELQSKFVAANQNGQSSGGLLTPEYLQLRSTILEALNAYPQAKLALASKLSGFGNAGP
jgi:hypothetical protein